MGVKGRSYAYMDAVSESRLCSYPCEGYEGSVEKPIEEEGRGVYPPCSGLLTG